MKRKILSILASSLLLLVTGCEVSNVTESNLSFENSNSDYLTNSQSDVSINNSSNTFGSTSNPIDYYVIPESFEINERLYEIDRNFDKSTITIDCLIGHIIYEKDLSDYLNEYPDLLAVIDNYFICSDNKIAIYTIKNNADGQIIEDYLAIKYSFFTDIFKLKGENQIYENTDYYVCFINASM